MSLLSLIRNEKLKQKISSKSDIIDQPSTESANPSSEIYIPSSVLLLSDLIDLDQYKVGSVEDIFYIPRACSDEMSAYLLSNIDQKLWTIVRQRKLMSFTEDIFETWLQVLCADLVNTGIFGEVKPNHVLVNRYEHHLGEGILHHSDGPAYLDLVVILSLQSSSYFTFKRKIPTELIGIAKESVDISLLLEPNSLLVFKGAAYNEYLHGIDANQEIDLSKISICDNLRFVGKIDASEVRHIFYIIASFYTLFFPPYTDILRAKDFLNYSVKKINGYCIYVIVIKSYYFIICSIYTMYIIVLATAMLHFFL